jgi:hypothetical protein
VRREQSLAVALYTAAAHDPAAPSSAGVDRSTTSGEERAREAIELAYAHGWEETAAAAAPSFRSSNSFATEVEAKADAENEREAFSAALITAGGDARDPHTVVTRTPLTFVWSSMRLAAARICRVAEKAGLARCRPS